jgi:hypothetical protein
VFARDGYKSYGLELTPRLFVSPRAVDAGLDGAVVLSVLDFIQLRVGGAIFSHAGATQYSVSGGLSAWF